jgi:hypothetical protein
LTVYDITGRLIKTLVNKQQQAGNYSVNWIAGNEVPGLYFYKIQAGRFVEVKKCTLLR